MFKRIFGKQPEIIHSAVIHYNFSKDFEKLPCLQNGTCSKSIAQGRKGVFHPYIKKELEAMV